MIAIVDYAKGNLQSVEKGLEAAGAHDVRIVTTPEELQRPKRLCCLAWALLPTRPVP